MNNPIDPHQHESIFGVTRTRVGPRHALITSDGFVPSHWPGAGGVEVVFHITPALGAELTQARLTWRGSGSLPLPALEGIERFFYVLSGEITLAGELTGGLSGGQFGYLAPGRAVDLSGNGVAVVVLFEKRFEPLLNVSEPASFVGRAADCPSVPFLGNEKARVQQLIPDRPDFDLAVNIFTYQPGATLPFVETHIMEHGLLMLTGQGVYRLEDQWYPVRTGDVIWMAPYCPQWFVAMGDEPASYLYYKNVNRLPQLK
jgi:(S)-ureidoglycine aminohydrolase